MLPCSPFDGRRAGKSWTAGALQRGPQLPPQRRKEELCLVFNQSADSKTLAPCAIYATALAPGRIAPHYQEAFTPVPSLLITYTRQGAALRMEWAAAGFVLEQTTDLANPSGWTDVPGGDVDFHTRARPELLPAKKTMRV